jgi:hypothetical protein
MSVMLAPSQTVATTSTSRTLCFVPVPLCK